MAVLGFLGKQVAILCSYKPSYGQHVGWTTPRWLYCAAINPAITQPHMFTVHTSRENGSYKKAIFQQAEVAI